MKQKIINQFNDFYEKEKGNKITTYNVEGLLYKILAIIEEGENN